VPEVGLEVLARQLARELAGEAVDTARGFGASVVDEASELLDKSKAAFGGSAASAEESASAGASSEAQADPPGSGSNTAA